MSFFSGKEAHFSASMFTKETVLLISQKKNKKMEWINITKTGYC